MYFGNNDMNNDIILSVLQHIFHRNCTIDDIRKTDIDLLQAIIDDILYLSDIPTKMSSSKDFIDNPGTKIFIILKCVQTTFMHHPENISRSVYIKLNDKLTDIIKKSTIEYDISMAYLLKYIIKEILVNGTHYSWKDKLETFYYICSQLRFIEVANMRSNKYTHQAVDLISSLNRIRQLSERKPLMEIIRDSIY